MKKLNALVSIIRLCLCVLLVFVSTVSSAEEKTGTWGKLTWKIDNNGVLLIKGNGPMVNLSSEDDAWKQYKSIIKKIVVDVGITGIGANAFSGCQECTDVSLPDGLITISSDAFSHCVNLTQIDIPSSVEAIGSWCFTYTGLKEIEFPDSIKTLGYYPFTGCSHLKKIKYPQKLSYLGEGFAYDCSALTEVLLPDGNDEMEISVWGFAYCSSLTSLTIPEGYNRICSNAFQGCKSLKKLVIPDSVTYFGSDTGIPGNTMIICNKDSAASTWAEANGYVLHTEHTIVNDPVVAPTQTQKGSTEGSHCSVCGEPIVKQRTIPALCDLTVLRLPASLKTIDNEAFSNLSCQAVIIPYGCKTIKAHAFQGCKKLIYVQIPSSVTSIADDAFEGCNANITLFRQE